ncbi:PREDICTED: uncharacterized protein LOC106810050 [Priapulus caudatus]|uniref:Uncharacterized protein LOC106810050 n=1 Tax=Priapulus caudatus TaxID=37621 RepID=A0ABM1E9C9_PRICU|nr:PREDICTED: uncharacterized protein LOC106810050 [Priapulus caudatus]
MADPVKLRGQRKSVVVIHLNSLARNVDEGSISTVTSCLEMLSVAFDELEAAHYEYHDTLEEEGTQEESQSWLDGIQSRYVAGVKSARAWLREQTPPQSEEEGGEHDKQSLLNLIIIPKVEIEVFTGDPLQYQTFMAIFDEAVHNKCSDGQARLTRLLQYTGGPAKDAIRNCALIGGATGYQQARDILARQFGNPHLISQSIFRSLTSDRTLSTASEIQQLADEIVSAGVALKRLGMLSEIDSQKGMLEIIQRCPTFIKAQWRRKALQMKLETDDYPVFNDFADFMRRVALEMNDPVYGDKSGYQTPRGVGSKVNSPQSNRRSLVAQAEVTGAGPSRSPCVSCGYTSHPLHQCEDFKRLSPRMRFDLVVKNRLCFVCFSPKHRAPACKMTPTCQVHGCKRKHSKLLHFDSTSTDVCSNVGNDSVANKVVSNVYGGTGVSVYIPMVPVIVNDKVCTWALLDSGSTDSFVSAKLTQDLRLKGSGVSCHLITLGSSRDVKSTLVSVDITSSEGQVIALKNAMVVPNIPATHPREPIDIQRYPHLKDLPIPHPTGDVQAEVLIGMDNAHLLMQLEVVSSDKPFEQFAT